MKKMKKLLAVFLAAAMVLAMGLTAFAASVGGSGTNNDNGSITINNAVEGQTYSIYQLFTLESYSYADDTSEESKEAGAYAYTIASDSDWYDFVKEGGAGAAYVTLKRYADPVGGVTTYYVSWNETDGAGHPTDAAEFAKAALKYAEDSSNGVTAKAVSSATTSTITFSGLNLGYYLVDSSLGTLCSLNTTNPQVIINEKNGVPTVDKEVQEDSKGKFGKINDADVGDIVTFQTTITAYAGADSYVLHDKMSAGLDYQGVQSVVLKRGDSADRALTAKSDDVTTEYSADNPSGYMYEVVKTNLEEKDPCTFHIVFTQAYLDTLEDADELVVTYTAKVTEKALVGSANTNETWLNYGDESQTDTSTTETYTWALNIYKYTEYGAQEGKKIPLKDAKFVLYKRVTETEGADPVKYYAVFDKDVFAGWTMDSNAATILSSDEKGNIAVKGLDADTYYLEETAAPDGYNKLDGPIMVVIDKAPNTNETYTETVNYFNYDNTKDEPYSGEGNTAANNTVKVLNNTGAELPSTGGMGTAIFYIAGVVLVVGAGVLLVARKRMSMEK